MKSLKILVLVLLTIVLVGSVFAGYKVKKNKVKLQVKQNSSSCSASC